MERGQLGQGGRGVRIRRRIAAAGLTLALLSFGAPATAAGNPTARENSRPGNPGWVIPDGAGTVISGYGSQISLLPGQTALLHVSAPGSDSYRVALFRLGWYGGVGGRLVLCRPACNRSRPAVAQPAATAPDPRSGLFVAPWSVTDRVPIPRGAVSGYYEAKLEVVSGPDAGAVGMVPLVVRERAPRAAILVQVPVNTWEAYNPWGGKSLYGSAAEGNHATEVSFDRPFDLTEFHNMQLALELPWVRFLERSGYDLAYQTDLDTDANPESLVEHRLVLSVGHDEYWTQAMRNGFDRARRLGTNLAFGSNSDLWRMRYADRRHRRTVVEWRNPYADPIHRWRYDTGFFRQFGEPECRLMAVEYQEYAQRWLLAPPTSYTVVGSSTDPWLSAAGLRPGEVIPSVVGYEWDSLVPGCFHGHVVSLMHAVYPGPDGVERSADMVRATAPSGARVFAMGTMELAWALDASSGQTPDPRVQAFVRAALRDLGKPAPPAALSLRRNGQRLLASARLLAPDPRVLRVEVTRLGAGGRCADALHARCRLALPLRAARYAAVAVDRWGRSRALIVALRRG